MELSNETLLEIFIEGSMELQWLPNTENSFKAYNPVTKKRVLIARKTITDVEFPSLKNSYIYELTIAVKTEEWEYTTIRSGDWSSKIDNLMKDLFSAAQHSTIRWLIEQ